MIKIYCVKLKTYQQYWGWHDLFTELILHYKNIPGYKIIYSKNLGKETQLDIPKFDYTLWDCEILIHDEEKDVLKGLSFNEGPTGLLDLFKKRNKKGDLLLITQYYNVFPLDFDDSIYNFKIKPTTYYTFAPHCNYDFFYRQRMLNKGNLIDKMFCHYMTDRWDVPILREKGVVNKDPGLMPIEQYLGLAIKYKIGMAVAGMADICHRDIEYMAIGIPMLRLEYITPLNPPLLPDVHYIAVDRSPFGFDANKDRIGGDDYVKAYIERFNEAKDDEEFLDYISKNAREYYENYCSLPNRLYHLKNLLEL